MASSNNTRGSHVVSFEKGVKIKRFITIRGGGERKHAEVDLTRRGRRS